MTDDVPAFRDDVVTKAQKQARERELKRTGVYTRREESGYNDGHACTPGCGYCGRCT